MINSMGEPSSAISGPNGNNADYDLPSFIYSGITLSDGSIGLGLENEQGTNATGYTWTGSVICSMPCTTTFNGTQYTCKGYTFNNAYVEVNAQMPFSEYGDWPAIWFLAAPGSSGPEIDLHEGGFTDGSYYADTVMHSTLWYANGTNSEFAYPTGVDLSAGFHKYGIAYKSGSYVKIYFDGTLIKQWTSNVPTGSYFIIVNNSMASSLTAGWHTQITPGQTGSSNWMGVKSVSVYNLQ
jgi:hypothetical protein